MDGFGFSETEQVFRREVRTFVQRELKPSTRERAHKPGISRSLLKKIADIGLLGIQVPEGFGGQETGWVSLGIAAEELGRAIVADGFLPAATHQVLSPLLANGELAEEWLPGIVAGEKGIVFFLVDPEAMPEAANSITARRDGDQYILSGRQVPFWTVGGAEALLIVARTNPNTGVDGFTSFLVPAAMPGISMSKIATPGLKAFDYASVTLEGTRLPRRFRLGEEGQGLHLAANSIGVSRVAMALASLGAAGASLEEAVEYAKERTAFGQPLAKFQAISFKIAENLTLLESARLLCYKTLWLRDQGLPGTKEASMSKWYCCELAADIIHDSLLVFGNVGYSDELPLAQRYKDVLGFGTVGGSGETSKAVIARELIDREQAS